MSYNSEIWYGSSFYDGYQGTVEKQRWNRRKPPSATEFFLSILAELDLFESFETILLFFQKKFLLHLTFVIFHIFYCSTKSNWEKKNKLVSNDLPISNSTGNGEKIGCNRILSLFCFLIKDLWNIDRIRNLQNLWIWMHKKIGGLLALIRSLER